MMQRLLCLGAIALLATTAACTAQTGSPDSHDEDVGSAQGAVNIWGQTPTLSVTTDASGNPTLHGTGFTPGGTVRISVLNRTTNQQEAITVTASPVYIPTHCSRRGPCVAATGGTFSTALTAFCGAYSDYVENVGAEDLAQGVTAWVAADLPRCPPR